MYNKVEYVSEKMKMVRILHCADLHLDSPFILGSVQKSEARRKELRGVFTSMMLYSKTNNIDIMLMSGDLFDTSYVTRETVELMKSEFLKMPECKFVISPGNHDPYTPDSVYARAEFPDNVYIFDSDRLSCFSFDDLGVDVYGYAFTSPTLDHNPFAGMVPKRYNTINIICAHGDTTSPISNDCPITAGDMRESGFDYIALGHIHAGTGVVKIDGANTYYAYPGCLEGRDYGETGYKGAIYAEISKEKGVVDIKWHGQRFSKRRYEVEKLDVSGCSGRGELKERIRAFISQKKYGQDTALRLILEGNVSPETEVSSSDIETEFGENLYEIEVINKTLPLYNSKLLSEDPTVRGEFFRQLLPILENGTPEEREEAALALKIGLAALNGSDFTEIG